jgi:hypothetical protein
MRLLLCPHTTLSDIRAFICKKGLNKRSTLFCSFTKDPMPHAAQEKEAPTPRHDTVKKAVKPKAAGRYLYSFFGAVYGTDNGNDIVLFDTEESWTVDPDKMHSKARNTPFKGITLKGRVKATILDGKMVYDIR